MKAFGPRPWGPAQDDPRAYVEAPVGAPCLHCDEPIAAGELGVLMPFVDVNGAREVAMHRECMLRGIFGSVGHQQGVCTCFGGEHEDPPGMTKREAARAACVMFEGGAHGKA